MINSVNFKELIKKGYSLDIVYLLQHLDEIDEICQGNPKLETLKNTLIRKGLISEEFKITLEGKQLLQFVSSPQDKIAKIEKVKKLDEFDRWWAAYPSTDSFEYKNKTFIGSRALRGKKADCKAKLYSILNEGEYTIDELIGALETEVNLKKEASIKEKKNKLSYMQNSATYLNQRTYESFVDLYRSGIKTETKEYKGVDV